MRTVVSLVTQKFPGSTNSFGVENAGGTLRAVRDTGINNVSYLIPVKLFASNVMIRMIDESLFVVSVSRRGFQRTVKEIESSEFSSARSVGTPVIWIAPFVAG